MTPKPPKLLNRPIKILAPADSILDPKELASAVRAKFEALCDTVRREHNLACDDQSLLLLLLANYEVEEAGHES